MIGRLNIVERIVGVVYASLLVLYPHSFRALYRDELLTTFHALSTQYGLRGKMAQWAFWAHALVDVVLSAVRLRVRSLTTALTRATHQQHPHDTQGLMLMEPLLQDIRYTFRTWIRRPAVILGSIFTLAIGIGGTTAIFSLANGIMFNTFSGDDADRMAFLLEAADDGSLNFVTYENFRDWQREAASFEHIGVFADQSVAVTGDGRPERVRGMFVSGSFFDVTQATFPLGRAIRPDESVPGSNPVAVLSHGYWQQRFGGDLEVAGRTITLNNIVHTIVGVVARDFQFPWDRTSVWISLSTYPSNDFSRTRHAFFAVGRLREGITFETAEQNLDEVQGRIAAEYPDLATWSVTQVDPMREAIVGSDTRTLLLILLGAVGMVLLIVCANVANLQLVRTIAREPEIAVRMALGGGRRRIIRQLYVESVLLAAVGGTLGVVLAIAAHGAVRQIATLRGPVDVGFDARVLFFSALVTLGTSVLFGLSPALHMAKTDVVMAIRRAAAVTRGRARLRNTLVAAQMAIAVTLLIGAGLLAKSLMTLTRVDTGFDRVNLLTAEFRLPQNKYTTDESVVQLFDELRERLGALPGVQGAATARSLPFSGNESTMAFVAEGSDIDTDDAPLVRRNQVSPNYFEVMDIPVLQGRTFTQADRADAPRVAMVSRALAERHFGGDDPIGKRFQRGGELAAIVGVVGDVRTSLEGVARASVYFPQAQEPAHFTSIALRTSITPHTLAEPIRQALWQLDADQPMWEIMTINERIATGLTDERVGTLLLATFALVALGLAAVGIGGVIAYMVKQRSRDIGIRMALGAGKLRVTSMVVGQGARLLAVGVVVGLAGSIALSRILESWLFGVEPFDLTVYATAPVVLMIVGIAACWIPARRATRVDPAVAMREE